jgi:hypothetical protein
LLGKLGRKVLLGRRRWRGGPTGGTAACTGFPARWPTTALGWHAWVLA